MTLKTPEKKRARALQKRTNWSYCECLRCVRAMSDAEIDILVEKRAKLLREDTSDAPDLRPQ